MKVLAVVLGIVVIIILLVGSGAVGAGICLNQIGCMATTGDGISLDRRQSVTIVTGNP